MALTTEQQKALNAFLATLGVASDPVVWYRDTSTPVPTEPLADVTNVAEIKRYMAHGFRTNLKRGTAPQDWDARLTLCDGVYAAKTPQEADAIVPGAGHFDPDTAVNLILGGGVQGGLFTPLTIYAPWGSGFDMVSSAAWLVAAPGYAGPGGE